MKLLTHLIIFFCVLLVYLHIYIHFKISDYNEFKIIDEVSKQSILSSTYYKLPFVFDGTTIIKPIDLIRLKKEYKEQKEKEEKGGKNEKEKVEKKDKIYKNEYESLALLEPSVRYFTNNNIYELKKNKTIDLHYNLHCRNFYIIHSGKVTIYCIHPKHKNSFDKDNLEKINETHEILQVELHPNSILFVPNYWYIFVKAHEKSVVERVQYKTILNEANFLYDKFKY